MKGELSGVNLGNLQTVARFGLSNKSDSGAVAGSPFTTKAKNFTTETQRHREDKLSLLLITPISANTVGSARRCGFGNRHLRCLPHSGNVEPGTWNVDRTGRRPVLFS